MSRPKFKPTDDGSVLWVCAYGHEHEVESDAIQHDIEAEAFSESVPVFRSPAPSAA
jgi:hypothetical protein